MEVEWRRRLHPPMQTPRLSLLRLGRQLTGHEGLHQEHTSQVRQRKPSNRDHSLPAAEPSSHHPGSLHQRTREGRLRAEHDQ